MTDYKRICANCKWWDGAGDNGWCKYPNLLQRLNEESTRADNAVAMVPDILRLERERVESEQA